MSDFIKVNFKNGYSCYTSKIGVEISAFEGCFYIYTFTLSATIFNVGLLVNEKEIRKSVNSCYEVTREEYDRLCKELGVE